MSCEKIIDESKWTLFVDANDGTIFFHWNILKSLEKKSGYQFIPFGIYKGEQLICIIPLFYKKIFFMNFYFSPPPGFGIPYMGLLFVKEFEQLKTNKKEEFLSDVFQVLNIHINDFFSYSYITNSPGLLDMREFLWNNYEITPRYTYYVDISPSLDEIFLSFKKEVRKNINKSIKDGLYIEKSDNLNELYIEQKNRYNAQGLSVDRNLYGFIKENMENYKDIFNMYELKDSNKRILSSILIIKDSKYQLWVGHSKPEEYSNDIFIWELIHDAKNNGYSLLEIIGANTKNLSVFKSKFNPDLKLYFEIEKSNFIHHLLIFFYKQFIKKKWL